MQDNEWITSNEHNDAWKCICGNDVMSDGFFHVTIKLTYPSVGHSETGDDTLSVCMQCGRLIDQETIKPNPKSTDEWDSHLVQVVGYVPFSTLLKLVGPVYVGNPDESPYALSDCINWESNTQGDCGGRVAMSDDGRVRCENCQNKYGV